MKNLFILFLMTLFVQSCGNNIDSSDYYKGYETPSYHLLEKKENIEIREYSSNLIAEVVVDGDRKQAANTGFKILAKYIFGDNSSKNKIDMTSPVFQTKNSQDKWLITFTMPRKYDINNLPKPIDEVIAIKNSKEKKIVAITFSGSWNDARFNQEKVKLEEFISQNNLKTLGNPIFAYYDDPFTFPWNKRNEVMWEIK